MWRADQLGAQAFEEGRHADAAELFEDASWRATSLYREGRFDEAASVLAESEALADQYNMGNSLAHAGRLEAAVAAYDQVLSAQPEHADARHNRDLVAKLLEQEREEEPPQQGQEDQDPANDSPSNSSDGSDASDEEPGEGEQQDASSGSDGAGPQEEAETSSQDESSASGTGARSGQDDEPGSEADTESDSEQADVDPAGSGSQDSGEAAGEDSEERSGRAGTERDGADRGDDPQHADTKPPSAGGAQAAGGAEPAADEEPRRGPASSMASQPLSEQEQAVEQWLGRVSDDRGGLLREKLRRRYARKRYLESMGGRTR
jgi:Ca-activated chloride channel family protein